MDGQQSYRTTGTGAGAGRRSCSFAAFGSTFEFKIDSIRPPRSHHGFRASPTPLYVLSGGFSIRSLRREFSLSVSRSKNPTGAEFPIREDLGAYGHTSARACAWDSFDGDRESGQGVLRDACTGKEASLHCASGDGRIHSEKRPLHVYGMWRDGFEIRSPSGFREGRV